MAARLQRLAQTADVHIHRTFLDKHMVAPDLVQQLGARMDALGMGHEKLQQAEFRGSQLQMLSARADAMRDRIERESADFHRRFGRMRSRTPQQRLDPRDAFLDRLPRAALVLDRVGVEVVGALEALRGEEVVDLVRLAAETDECRLYCGDSRDYAADDVDLVLTDGTAGAGYVAASDGGLKIIGEKLGTEDFGFIFPKGSDLAAPMNAAIEALKADGTFDALNKKWFLDINSGTDAAPTWIGVFGIQEFKPTVESGTGDTSDFASGWKGSQKTSLGWALEM